MGILNSQTLLAAAMQADRSIGFSNVSSMVIELNTTNLCNL